MPTSNAELRAVYEADQADRQGQLDAALAERDRQRRQRVAWIEVAGGLHTAEDFFHTALIFQHGDDLSDYWKAHELAKSAAQLGHPRARWLAAAAYDRWLVHQGRPQKYGTQYVPDGDRWRLADVDPSTTDDERAEWNVPPLAVALEHACELTANRSPGRSMAGAGPWLAELEVPHLSVRVIAVPTDTPRSVIEPLAPGDEHAPEDEHVTPTWLPEGSTVCRYGLALCAVGPSGELSAFWQRLQSSFHVQGWRWPDRRPVLQAVQVGSHAGVLISGAGDDLLRLIVPGWFVGAALPLNEAIRLAASLPIEVAT